MLLYRGKKEVILHDKKGSTLITNKVNFGLSASVNVKVPTHRIQVEKYFGPSVAAVNSINTIKKTKKKAAAVNIYLE